MTTQFVLNIAAAPSTKMTATAVQQAGNFRGIQDVKLFTYKTGMTSGTPYVLSTTGAEEKEFDFGAFFASGGIDNSTGNNQSGDKAVASKRVLQLSIPLALPMLQPLQSAVHPERRLLLRRASSRLEPRRINMTLQGAL